MYERFGHAHIVGVIVSYGDGGAVLFSCGLTCLHLSSPDAPLFWCIQTVNSQNNI